MSEKIDFDEITSDEIVQLQKNYYGIIHRDDRAKVFNLGFFARNYPGG